MGGVILLVGIGILALIMRTGFRRFERQRRAEGAWDENGPIHPSSGLPPGAGAYEIFDGGLRRAFEREHGAELQVRHAPIEPAPIIEVGPSPPEPPPSSGAGAT